MAESPTVNHKKWIVPAAVVVAVVLAFVLLPGHLGIPPYVSETLFVNGAVGDDAGLPPERWGEPRSPVHEWVGQELAPSRDAEAVANFGIYAEPMGPGAYLLRTFIWHAEDMRMKSMRISFQLQPGQGTIALMVPEGGPWNDPQFVRDPATGDVSFSVDRLGFMGIGSIQNEFVYRGVWRPGQTNVFNVRAEFTLGGLRFLQFKETRAAADILIELPVEQ